MCDRSTLVDVLTPEADFLRLVEIGRASERANAIAFLGADVENLADEISWTALALLNEVATLCCDACIDAGGVCDEHDDLDDLFGLIQENFPDFYKP